MSDGFIGHAADAVAAAGLIRAFGITGSGASLGLIDRLMQHGIEYVPVMHEASAALMAGAAGNDGSPGACAITIRGPGFINLAPGLLSNLYEGRACLTLSESLGSTAPRHRQHKRLDQEAASRQLVKAYATCDERAENVDWLLRHARSEYPGPVHMDIGPGPEMLRQVFQEPSFTVDPAKDMLQGVLDQIDSSSRPALVLGSLVKRCPPELGWSSLRLPVLTTAAGKGAVDEASEWAGGVITGEVKALSPETTILAHADLVVGIGLRNTEMVKAAPFGCPLVIVDSVRGHDAGFGAAHSLLGVNITEAVPGILQALQAKSWGAEHVRVAREKVREAVSNGSWTPGHAFRVLSEHRAVNATLVPDTGFFCTIAETVWPASTPASFHGSSVGRFMGLSIPSAMGVAIADPQRTIYCCFGDGGVAPYIGELPLAVERKLPILFVFFTDGRYGSVASFAPSSPGLDRVYTFQGRHWIDVFSAMGLDVHRANSPERMACVLSDWDRSRGPAFLELRFDPDSYAQAALPLR